jgi:hypothetical protein
MRFPLKRLSVTLAVICLVTAIVAVPAAAASSGMGHDHDHDHGSQPPVVVQVITPSEDGIAGAGGVFNVDVSLQARTPADNDALSAANGYRPFLNLPGSSTFGPGMPDPGAPGLVVLESTTPQAAGGPNANLAGVFQLNAVERVHNLQTTFNDWQVGSPGFFGTNVDSTITVFVVQGTAPGLVDMSQVHPISNVVRVHFHIAG